MRLTDEGGVQCRSVDMSPEGQLETCGEEREKEMGKGFRCGDGEMRQVDRQDPLTCNVARRREYPKAWCLGLLGFPMFLGFS